jgi:transmembrane sensor
MDAATDQAIDWLVRLDSGHASDEDHHAFAHWLGQSPGHVQAWATVQQRLSAVEPALVQLRRQGEEPVTLGRQALVAPVPKAARRRGLLRGGVAALLASTATAWLVHRQTPLTTLVADLRTGTGQRSHHQLPDGSEIDLDARSAADIAYSASRRLVRLREGALLVQVAASAPGKPQRPFVVQSAEGSAQALGTRFMVRQGDGRTLVHVMEHSVLLTSLSGRQHRLEEGRSAWMDADGIQAQDTARLAPSAWVDGVIEVRDQPLGDVVDALRPYQAGLIRISPEAARLRIFGVFQLARPDQVLQDLVDTQPISVRRWGQWLTLIDVRDRTV